MDLIDVNYEIVDDSDDGLLSESLCLVRLFLLPLLLYFLFHSVYDRLDLLRWFHLDLFVVVFERQ